MTRADQLAVMGGPPRFAEPLHVGRPNVGDVATFQRLTERILADRWLTNDGPMVRRLEAELQGHVGAEHVVCVDNATTGLQIAIRALGLRGEVIVPSFTFVATAHALDWLGLTPVFADVDESTHNLDPESVADRITGRTTAILAVHLWGRAAPVDDLQRIADRAGIRLFYDAAHAFRCSAGDRTIGGFGDCEVFSFHATKFFNTFEGGAIATDDSDLAARLRLLRNFGFAGYDQVVSVGINAKLSEISAAMGLTNLAAVESFEAANRRNVGRYVERLSGVPGIRLLDPAAFGRSNYQYAVALVDSEVCPLTRDELLHVLWADNVRARRYFYPGAHRMAPYASRPAPRLPVTERLSEQVLVLPNGSATSEDDTDAIAGILAAAIDRAGDVRRAVQREAQPPWA